MTELSHVLVLSLLPGAGNFAGGIIAEFWRPSARLLNWALHAASGIVVAIVAIELIPHALPVLAGWQLAAAFAAGGLAYIGLQAGVQRLQSAGDPEASGMWMVYCAVAIDLVSDGLVLGAGSAVSWSLALVLASGQILADIPEGYASIATFRRNGVVRQQRLWLAASFVIFCTGSATLAYFALRQSPQPIRMAALVFVAAMLTLAAVEDILEEAHRSNDDGKRSMLAFLAGFVLFALVSIELERIVSREENPRLVLAATTAHSPEVRRT